MTLLTRIDRLKRVMVFVSLARLVIMVSPKDSSEYNKCKYDNGPLVSIFLACCALRTPEASQK